MLLQTLNEQAGTEVCPAFETHRGSLVRSGHLPRVSGGERRTEVQAEGAGPRCPPGAKARPCRQMGSCLLPTNFLQSPRALLGGPSQEGSGPRPGGAVRLSLGWALWAAHGRAVLCLQGRHVNAGFVCR